jgi:hypothetical protein
VRSPSKNGVIPKLGATDLGFDPKRAGCLVDAAPAPWRLRRSEVFELAIHLCEAGVPAAQIITHRRADGL